MKTLRLISFFWMTLLIVACRSTVSPEDPSLADGNNFLGIEVTFPEMGLTKAEVGELPASELENAIHSLIIWVFDSGEGHEPLVSKEIDAADFPVSGGVRRYSLPVMRDFAANHPSVDVFVLANKESVGLENLGEDASWETLNSAFFSDDSGTPYNGFGLTSVVHAVNEELGLPMSACGKGLEVAGEEPVYRVKKVKLMRAVSRLRYVFCKTQTLGEEEEDEVAINRIILEGNQIPNKEYVFTTSGSGVVLDQPAYSGAQYIVNWPADTQIAENDTPEALIYVNQDALTYERILDEAVRENTLTDLGYTYFRESDLRLTGLIEYTVNGVSRTREFNMASKGDFARNHTWTVFGYFLSGRNLQLALKVMPWDYNAYNVDFSYESLNVSAKFAVDEGSAEVVLTSKDHYDVRLLPGVAAKGHLTVTTPVGGTLMIRPVGDAYAFNVTSSAVIDPTVNGGRIDISVSRNPAIDENLTNRYITLSFSVETTDGRIIDADTEAIDAVYRFVL